MFKKYIDRIKILMEGTFNMEKKKFKVLSIVLVSILVILIICMFVSKNKTEQRILDLGKNLVNSIKDGDYESVKKNLKTKDGKTLSDEQLNNFLINTELYRTLIWDEKRTYNYEVETNLLNNKKGNIVFSFKALNGDLITNELKYVRKGRDEYFITSNIKEAKLKKKRYPISINLANKSTIDLNESKNIINDRIKILSYIQEENNNYIEIAEDAVEDVMIMKLNTVNNAKKHIKKMNKKYNIKINKTKDEFSVYYDKDDKRFEKTTLLYMEMQVEILTYSYLSQALEGKSDWHLTIKYYDCNTEKLLNAEKLR